MYGAKKHWGMRSTETRKVDTLEMNCLRSLFVMILMKRVRNEEMHRIQPTVHLFISAK